MSCEKLSPGQYILAGGLAGQITQIQNESHPHKVYVFLGGRILQFVGYGIHDIVPTPHDGTLPKT